MNGFTLPRALAALVAISIAYFVLSLYGVPETRTLALSLALGGIFGFVLQRSRFCFFCHSREYLEEGNPQGVLSILLALGAGTLAYLVVLTQWMPLPLADRLPPTAHIGPVSYALALGAFVFGAGMSISGSCISAHIYRLGEGSPASPFALVGSVIGFGLGFASWNTLYLATIVDSPVVWLPHHTLGHRGIDRLDGAGQAAGCPLCRRSAWIASADGAAWGVGRQAQRTAGRALQGCDPVQRGAHCSSAGLEHGGNFGLLRPADRHTAWLQHSGLFGRDAGQIGAQILAVIQPQRCHPDHAAIGMAAGGIEPAAQSHLQHHQGQPGFGEGQKGGGRHQFEGCELVALGHLTGTAQMAAQHGSGDRVGPQPDALGPAHQVR